MCASCTKHWYSFCTELKVKFCVKTHQTFRYSECDEKLMKGNNTYV